MESDIMKVDGITLVFVFPMETNLNHASNARLPYYYLILFNIYY